MKHVPMVQLQSLFGVPQVKDRVRPEMERRVKELFEHFGLPWALVRGAMGDSNAVLGGSGALEIAVPGTHFPDTLDFFCPWRQAEGFVHFLLDQTALDMVEEEDVTTGAGGHWPGILETHELVFAPNGSRIRVLASTTASAHAPILFAASTPSMNFVSSDGVAMFYSSLTTKGKGKQLTSAPVISSLTRCTQVWSIVCTGLYRREPTRTC